MNSHREFDDSRQMDRLVDGELAGDEYRAFLATLDKEPDGWRRCALAFLEAQAWGQELGESREEVLAGRNQVSGHVAGHRNSKWSTGQVVGSLLAIAASFAMAFASGVWWHNGNSSNSQPDFPAVARQDGDSRPAALEEGLAREADLKPAPGGVPAEHLTFVVDRGNGESDRFELPIYDADDSVARQLLQDSPSMPAEVERAIRDSGFRVKSRRQWTPIRLRDGRRAIFPVDQLDITPVSESIYH